MPAIALTVLGNDALAICGEFSGQEAEGAQALIEAIRDKQAELQLEPDMRESLAAQVLSLLADQPDGPRDALVAVIDEALTMEQLKQTQHSETAAHVIDMLPYILGLVLCLRVHKLRVGGSEISFFEGVPGEVKDLVATWLATAGDTLDTISKRIKPPQ